MASIKTPCGKMYYGERFLYIAEKDFDRNIAFENLSILVNVMSKEGIQVSPAYGTLLGIIRENNFIEWDHDIDLFILREDKDKFLKSLWSLKNEGFELFRVGRCGYLYSIMRKDHYIDFYIMENISPEVRTSYGEFFLLDRFLTDLRDWDFRGLTISVPKDYEECLEFLYGDWRTPVKYGEGPKVSGIMVYLVKFLSWLNDKIINLLPIKIRFKLQKKHHKKDLFKFLENCKKRGVELHFDINY